MAAEKQRRPAEFATKSYTEGVGFSAAGCPERSSVVRRTNPGWLCPPYSGCCTVRRSFPRSHPMFSCRYTHGQQYSSFRIAAALRLGAEICSPHNCICGAPVDSSGVHGLSCRKSSGRQIRHSAVNGIIKRALASAEVPARLEPSSLSRDDGKRPDGMSLMPWKEGRCLIWDFTCADTLAQSHLDRAVLRAATVADDAEQRKRQKYVSLSATYYFVPICIETLGPMGEEAAAFFADVGQRIATATGEPRSKTFLMQRLSIAVQQGNAACVLGTVPMSTDLYI